MILKNNSENVKVLVKYFESLSIKDNLKLSIIVIQSDLIKLKVDKEKLVDILKNFLCVLIKIIIKMQCFIIRIIWMFLY